MMRFAAGLSIRSSQRYCRSENYWRCGMRNRFRLFLVAIATVALVACGPNQASVKLHPEFVHLRVILEHGTTMDELRKVTEEARLDFELNKTKLSDADQEVCDSALTATETFLSFASETTTADTLQAEYETFHELGAFSSKAEYEKAIGGYKDVSVSDSSQSLEHFELQRRINSLTIELVAAVVKKAVIQKVKSAETATS
jgi:hypothetical protein